MGRFEILKQKKIKSSKANIVEPLDKNVMTSISQLNKKIGQYKAIIVCEEKDEYLIVDGNKYFKSLSDNGAKKILCYNLGKLEEGEYEFLRLALNIHQSRLDYLGIAQIISYLSKQEHKSTTISNNTGIDVQSVERYSTLLDFDWDEFNRKQLNEQFNPFDDER